MNNQRPLWIPSGLLLILASAVSGCSSDGPPVTEPPPPTVSVSQPLTRAVVDHDDYEGRIQAVNTYEVRARVRGHLVKVNFEDGQLIKKDDLLFEIDPRPYAEQLKAAEAQLAGANAALELAQKEYARAYALLRSNAASREELDVWTGKQAVARADKLKAQAAVDHAKLELGYTKIASPIAGKASKALVTLGNLVNAGGGETLLTTVTSVDPMYVAFDVPERSLLRYREHFRKGKAEGGAEPSVKDLKIPVYVGLEGQGGYPLKGVIEFADNHVNPATGTILVRGVLPNSERVLDSGMRARVRIPVSDPRKSLLITERAVGTDQGRKFVYVVTDQNIAERRDVKLGRIGDGLQIIEEGVKPDDQIIVNGIQRVRDGAKVAPRSVAMPGAPVEKTDQKAKS